MIEIRKYNDPILKEWCPPLMPKDDVAFIKDMQQAMFESENAVGIAAPQIGILKRVIIVRDIVMINPVITKSRITYESTEGCLSYPSTVVKVQRSVKIVVKYQDLGYRRITKTLRYLEAAIVQHELDHLNGICLVKDEWQKLHQKN